MNLCNSSIKKWKCELYLCNKLEVSQEEYNGALFLISLYIVPDYDFE